MMSGKKKSSERTVQKLLCVEAISDSILWTQNHDLFAYIRVKGADGSLYDDSENQALTEDLTAALSDQRLPYQIISLPRTVDIQSMIRLLQAERTGTDSPARLQLLDSEIDALNALAEEGTKEPYIFIKLWQHAAPGADRVLLNRAALLAQKLAENRVTAEILEATEIRHLCCIYSELGTWQQADNDASDIPILKGQSRRWSRKPTPEEIVRAALLEEISPTGLAFQPDRILLGSAHCRCYGAVKYPSDISYGWAVRLMCTPDAVTCITFTPDTGFISTRLANAAKEAQHNAHNEKDLRKQKQLERSANSADRLIDEMDANNQPLGTMSIVVMPFGETEDKMDQAAKETVFRFAAKRIKLRQLTYQQEQAFRHISPYYPAQKCIQETIARVVPLETLMGGYPMAVDTIRDDHGIRFARTLDRGIVVVDIRKRGIDRTNGNGIVTGATGVGKSTFLKDLLETQFMLGMRIIAIDPERELLELCRNLGGVWLDAGGGRAKINLLQVQAQVLDNLEEGEKVQPLAEHIQYVKTVLGFKIPDLSGIQLALIERCLYELYAEYGINMDSLWVEDLAQRTPEEYPIMEDLYRLTVKKAKGNPEYEEIALLLESMAIGSDSLIWNGHTNIDLSNPLVVIDTRRLCDSTQRNQAAQYYTLMRQIFTTVSADRSTPFFVMADEAQTMLDPDLPTAARGLKNMALRIRKYEGYLWLVFHSLNELLDSRVREYGQPIADGPAYKILFGTDGKNLEDTKALFHLTPAEEKVLAAKQRGKALAFIGAQHLKVKFDIPAYKMKLMGGGGGR